MKDYHENPLEFSRIIAEDILNGYPSKQFKEYSLDGLMLNSDLTNTYKELNKEELLQELSILYNISLSIDLELECRGSTAFLYMKETGRDFIFINCKPSTYIPSFYDLHIELRPSMNNFSSVVFQGGMGVSGPKICVRRAIRSEKYHERK